MELNWDSNFNDSQMIQRNQMQQQQYNLNNHQVDNQYNNSNYLSNPNTYQTNNYPNNNYQSNQNINYDYEQPLIEYKKYIVMFVLIVIIYFILSLNPVKNAFGMILTCINPDDNGYVSYGGYLAYGIVIGLIVCICNYLVDRFFITY